MLAVENSSLDFTESESSSGLLGRGCVYSILQGCMYFAFAPPGLLRRVFWWGFAVYLLLFAWGWGPWGRGGAWSAVVCWVSEAGSGFRVRILGTLKSFGN